MGIISIEQQDRLFWLGRYYERVYTTLRMYSRSYDMMIDEIADSYHDFCKLIDIPDIYESKDDFRDRYPFDDTNPDSIIDRKSAGMAVLSVMKFLSGQGIVDYRGELFHESKIVEDVDMLSVQTAKSGIFEPLVKVGEAVEEGQPLANIVNPYDGECMETLYSPADSTVFFMHSDPLTYANTAVFKLISDRKNYLKQ